MHVVKETVLVIQSRASTVLPIELVHSPQQNVQAGIGGSIFGAEGLPQGITSAAAACELLI